MDEYIRQFHIEKGQVDGFFACQKAITNMISDFAKNNPRFHIEDAINLMKKVNLELRFSEICPTKLGEKK